MITRLLSEDLRAIADQIDALNQLVGAGAPHISSNTVLTVEGRPVAFAHWWDDKQTYMAEFLDFKPGDGPFRDLAGNIVTLE